MTRLLVHSHDDRSEYPAKRRPLVARRWWIDSVDGSTDRNYLRVEVHIDKRWETRLEADLRFDSPGGETQIDAHIIAGPAKLFLSTQRGATLNRLLRVKDGATRSIRLAIASGLAAPTLADRLTYATLQWSLWTDPSHLVMGRRDRDRLSRWYVARRGYVHPIKAVLDRALGATAYSVEKLATQSGTAWLPEGGYPLMITLQRSVWKRPRSRFQTQRTTADYHVVERSAGGPGLIPDGDFSYGSPDGLVASGTRDLTEVEAANPELWRAIAESTCRQHVLRDRAKERGSASWVPDPVPAGVLRSDEPVAGHA